MFASASAQSMRSLTQDARVVMAGLIQSIRTLVVKSGRSAGQKMAVITFEDVTGTAEIVVFSDGYARYGHLIEADKIVFLLGRIDLSRGEPQVVAERIVPIDGIPLLPGRLRLTVQGVRLNGTGAAALKSLAQIIGEHRAPIPGAAPAEGRLAAAGEIPAFPVELVVETEHGRVLLGTDPKLKVAPTPAMVERIARVLGPQCVRVVGGVALEVAADSNRPKWANKPRAAG
jgi:DNA polymerase-3 subunit alpha